MSLSRRPWPSILLLGAVLAGVAVTAPWQPRASTIGDPSAVELQVLAVRQGGPTGGPSIALVDLAAGTVKRYPSTAHGAGRDAVDGATITPRGHAVLWSQGVARLFTGGLDDVDTVLRPERQRRPQGVAPSLRVVPAPDGASAWLVQQGQDCCGSVRPGFAERVALPSGRRLAGFALAAGAFPVAATRDGLVLGHERLVDTGDGWVVEPGSERVLHLDASGSITELGRGSAVAASPSLVVRLDCAPGTGDCELHASRPDGGGDRRLDAPFAGRWLGVAGPDVPGDMVPWATVSPDGTELLIARQRERRDGRASSVLLAVDLTAGSSREIRRFDGLVPPATWSRDGRRVVLVEGRDLRILDATDPTAPGRLLRDVVPADHHVFAAG